MTKTEDITLDDDFKMIYSSLKCNASPSLLPGFDYIF